MKLQPFKNIRNREKATELEDIQKSTPTIITTPPINDRMTSLTNYTSVECVSPSLLSVVLSILATRSFVLGPV